jgi:hypothetical protein
MCGVLQDTSSSLQTITQKKKGYNKNKKMYLPSNQQPSIHYNNHKSFSLARTMRKQITV